MEEKHKIEIKTVPQLFDNDFYIGDYTKIDEILRQIVRNIQNILLFYFNAKHSGSNLKTNDYQWNLFEHLKNWNSFDQIARNFFSSFISLLKTNQITSEFSVVSLSDIAMLNIDRNTDGESYRFNLKTFEKLLS